MSDSISNDCLIHYNSQHIQVRKDFFDLCAYDKSKFNIRKNEKGNIIRDEPNQECMAKILRILETLTNSAREAWLMKALNAKKQGLKIPSEPKEYRIPLAYPAICTLLYDTYGASTVRNSVACLIQRGFITRYQETINSIPEYVLSIKVVQDALFQQAQAQSNNRLLNSTPTFQKKERPKKDKSAVENNSLGCRNQQPPPSNSTAQGSKFNSNNMRGDNFSKNGSKNEDVNTTNSEQKPSNATPSHTPTSTLLEKMTELEKAFWTLWCSMTFNVIAPKLTETAYTHVQALAPHITTQEQLNSLVEYSRQKLVNAKKDGTVHLGNLRNDLNEWKQKQMPKTEQPQKRVAPLIMTPEETIVDLDQQKSTGPKLNLTLEERKVLYSSKNKQQEGVAL